MKVLQIISGDLWAGAEAMAFQLLCGLSRRPQIKLSVVLLNDGKLAQLCRGHNIKTYVIDEKANSFALITLKIARLARKIKPDIIHSHRYKENTIAAIIQCACCLQGKLICTQHGRSETHGPKNGIRLLKKWINEFCMRKIFKVNVAVSEDTKRYLIDQCGISKNKIKTIPNGIDLLQYYSLKKIRKKNFISIGSAGRLFLVKNYTKMVDIAKQVCTIREEVKFILAGDGPERSKIEEKIQRYNLDGRFHLYGHVEDMANFYSEIDIYVNTSLHEGAPMTVLEAMACGKPVVAFHLAGLKEIVRNDYNGYTVTGGDQQEFVSKILELVDNPNLITKFGKNARETVENKYSTEMMVDAYQGIYKSIL